MVASSHRQQSFPISSGTGKENAAVQEPVVAMGFHSIEPAVLDSAVNFTANAF
jgi:hypothetical protein